MSVTFNNHTYYYDGQVISENPSYYSSTPEGASGGAIDPNQGMPPFDSSFDPNDPSGMAAKFREMMNWANAHNLNINACQVIFDFLVNMGNNYPTDPGAQAILESGMQQDLQGKGSLCEKIINVVISNIFYSATGNQSQIEATTIAAVNQIVQALAGISQNGNWLPQLYQNAIFEQANLQAWMDGQFDSSGNRTMNKDTWLIFAEGDWANFWISSNANSWIDGYYHQAILQIFNCHDFMLVYIMLMMLLLDRDNDGENNLGGLADVTGREGNFAQEVKNMITKFTSGGNKWSPKDAGDFYELLNDFKIHIDNDPAFSDIKAQADSAIDWFFNQTDPTTKETFEQLFASGDTTDLANAISALMPDPTSPSQPSNFYTTAVQNLQNLGSGMTSMSQVTGQQTSALQSTQQQREAAISAGFKLLTDQEQAMTNNMRPS